MGASLVYLDEPNKNIEWDTGEDARATFACGEMQGWRLNMVSLIASSILTYAIDRAHALRLLVSLSATELAGGDGFVI